MTRIPPARLIGSGLIAAALLWLGACLAWRETVESGLAYAKANLRVACAFQCLLAIVALNVYFAIRSAIARKHARLEAEARANSLTQPGSLGPSPPCDVAIRRPWKVHMRRPPVHASLYQCNVISFTLALLLIIPGHFLPFGLNVAKFLPVRLLRPGIQGQRYPDLEPLLVQVRAVMPHGPSRLYFNSRPISWDQLAPLLDQELLRCPPDWPVYVQGDADLEWQEVGRAIDIVVGKRAQVVLVPIEDAAPR